jgi:DNA-binding Xre family transcriptional regulator
MAKEADPIEVPNTRTGKGNFYSIPAFVKRRCVRIGEELRTIRTAYMYKYGDAWKVPNVAKRLGMASSTITRIESGELGYMATFLILCESYRVNPTDVLEICGFTGRKDG